ncbi:MAG TPA: hypothetical protein VGP08_00410 [Pyrinomonadaceae bacterium]|nr:hypothetical protein [Pyrinomonadaceae bacterium]
MSEENTQNLPDSRSFEERVFARFDAIDVGLRDLNARVEKLAAESEWRAVETKPIWERALAEIVAVSQKVDGLERKVDALSEEVAELREEVSVISRKVRAVDNKLGEIASDMLGLRADQKEVRKQVDKLESEHAR